jgi:hypothetical protein
MQRYEPIKGGPPGYSGHGGGPSQMTRFMKEVLPVLPDPKPKKKTRKPKTTKPTVKFIPWV